jgi:ribonuclease HI
MKVKIKWTYNGAKKPRANFYSELLQANEALLIMDDLEHINRATNIEFEDELGNSWTKKELKKLLEEIKDEPQDVTVYFDGGFLKNEALAGIGIVVYYTQNNNKLRLRVNKRMEQLTSNNEAEYAAFYEGMRILEELGVHHQPVTFKGDSQVVLNQLAGDWPCFEEEFNRWLDRIEEKIKELSILPQYETISRKQNSEADKLASQALEGTIVRSTLQL